MVKNKIRLGIIGSSGGSALAAANDCLNAAEISIEWVIITDRQCGIEKWAIENRYLTHRISYLNAQDFSRRSYIFFDTHECDNVMLFYTRRVDSPLINQKHVWNIHPSLLPCFRGLHGVRDAMAAGVKVFGATLHHVDAGLDTGKIAAQVCAPLFPELSESEVEHLSYLQKVWLILLWVDLLINPGKQTKYDSCGPGVALACPGIADERLRTSYLTWLANRNQK